MLNTKKFGEELKKMGFAFYSGVPCSYLKSLINFAVTECEYVMATNEGEAVAIAAGAAIGGKRPVVFMQNSGLTNASSPLASLIYPFRIPILGFVSLRGERGVPDEPQHELMGQITTQMLQMMDIHWEYLSFDFDEAVHQINRAHGYLNKDQSFFFVVKKGTFPEEEALPHPLKQSKNILLRGKKDKDQFPSRLETLKVINSLKDAKTIQLATTGKTGRELYELEDAPNNFYMVGSMGCVHSLGLGLALTKKDKDIVVIDGDGALLMRMGGMATNGTYSPPNLLHILLDNESYDSTGGQQTLSPNIDFTSIAAACGYPRSVYVHNLAELEEQIKDWKQNKGLTFLHIKIARGSKKGVGRPKIKPYEVKERLQVFLND